MSGETTTVVDKPSSPLQSVVADAIDTNHQWQPKEYPQQHHESPDQQQQNLFNTMNFHAMSDCIVNIQNTREFEQPTQRLQDQQHEPQTNAFLPCEQISSGLGDEYVSFECVKKLLQLDEPVQIDEYMVNNADGIASDMQSTSFEIDYFNGIM